MKLNKSEISRIKQALQIAIDSEYVFIDAHKTALKFINGDVESVIPENHKKTVTKTRRTIKAFDKLLNKLK